MVANLIDNAIAHNIAEDGWITVQTAVEGGNPVLRVANSGQIVPAGAARRAIRAVSTTRGRAHRPGSGTRAGLSIVRAIALAHGAEMDAEARNRGGLEVELRFAPALARTGATTQWRQPRTGTSSVASALLSSSLRGMAPGRESSTDQSRARRRRHGSGGGAGAAVRGSALAARGTELRPRARPPGGDAAARGDRQPGAERARLHRADRNGATGARGACTGGARSRRRPRPWRSEPGPTTGSPKPCHPEELVAQDPVPSLRRRRAGELGSDDEAVVAGELTIRPGHVRRLRRRGGGGTLA